MLLRVGTFGLNFPIFISTMAVSVFHAGAGQYGLLSSMMAAGSVSGALLAAARAKPSMTLLLTAAATFGVTCAAAAAAPSYLAFGFILFTIGFAAQTFTTSTNSMAQITTEPHMRGRVIAIVLAIALGGTPLGAPIVGRVADSFGPRWALCLGAASGILAAAIARLYLADAATPIRTPDRLERLTGTDLEDPLSASRLPVRTDRAAPRDRSKYRWSEPALPH